MFKPAAMQKVRIIALKSHVEDLIKTLHEAGLVEIKKTAIEGLGKGRPLEFFDEVSAQLIRLRAILSMMEEKKSGNAGA
ncbi:MAG: hypothetical protein ABII71_00170, partial [Candidatus Micrarchaeota archaeon]